MLKKGKLHFKTNVQLKSIIGKDLINDDNIAILELVKNSFDANAKKVTIKFLNIKSFNDDSNQEISDKSSRIVIQDNGIGMNLQDIKDKWLNIAYSEKKTNTRQHNRMMAGAKGVGRFSCDRLGEYLKLYSKVEDSDNYIQLIIDWSKFELDDAKDQEIQSIGLDYNILQEDDIVELGFEPFNKGVILEIINLRRLWANKNLDKRSFLIGWDINKLIDLKKYLEKLINPNQAFEKNDFGVFIMADEFSDENDKLPLHNKFIGKVENRIFDKLDFKSTVIESKIIDNGRIILTELKDKGETIFWIKEKNEHFPLIKDVKITLYYLNPYAKAFFTKQTGIRSVDYGSIFLFINGFRISPYGNVGNDWLGIDQRKAQGYARYIGLREYVGQIEILDRENDFQIISSREGIVRNDNYHSLFEQEGNKSYFFKTLRRLEKYVVDGLNWDSIPEDDKKKISEIEKKIISGETKEDDLIYREDEGVKERRTYELIHSIISAKEDNVIELYINEKLILKKINEEKEKSKKEFEQLLNDFENKKIDPNSLTQILLKKAGENKELEKEIKNLSKYSTNELTSKAILDLQNYKSNLENQSKIISSLKKQLEITEKERKKAEEERIKAEVLVKKAESKVEVIEKELTETNSQNLFLKSVKSQDFNELINLMHHIGISTATIQNYIKGVVFRLDNNLEIGNSELKSVFSKLNYELNKIYSISKFATKANFKVTTKEAKHDIIAFIQQYLINVVKPFLSKKISLIVYDSSINQFEIDVKPLELIIILDNLVNNSKKANSTKIEVSFKKINDSQIQFLFKDNGDGIDDENINKVFEYGYTTTDGSGLGLTHIKELVEKIGGKIKLNASYKGGAEFIIIFNKN